MFIVFAVGNFRESSASAVQDLEEVTPNMGHKLRAEVATRNDGAKAIEDEKL
jgi:hypothetical protein